MGCVYPKSVYHVKPFDRFLQYAATCQDQNPLAGGMELLKFSKIIIIITFFLF